jgi:hypothetical protein
MLWVYRRCAASVDQSLKRRSSIYINCLLIWNRQHRPAVLEIVGIAESFDLKEPAVVGLRVSEIGSDD